MKNKHTHKVDINGISENKKVQRGKFVSPNHKSISRTDLLKIYNKYYRDQVSALYRSLRHDDQS